MPSWLKDAVFYEIYPQSFCDSNGDGIGDIKGMESKLDYIQSLGCNALWINPVYDSPFKDAGYDVRDYYRVAERYGTNEDMYHFFQEAHKRNIKVLMDLVPGHTSDENEWFLESKKSDDNAYAKRYVWTNGAFVGIAGHPYISGVCEREGAYMLNFFASQPALNYGWGVVCEPWQDRYDSQAAIDTREALKDIMRFWLNHGCDGFRCDMADSLVKNDDDDKHATAMIWRNIREMLDKEYPDAALVSEWSNPNSAINLGGFHMDFYLDHEHNGYHALLRKDEAYFKKTSDAGIEVFLKDYLPKYASTRNQGYISMFTCNHDTPRLTNYLNLDEIKLYYAFLMTMPGVPFVYYGDEIGMQYLNLKSVEGGYHRTGSRTPMQWNRSKNAGFTSADTTLIPMNYSNQAPCVSEQLQDTDSLLNYLKNLIHLRHTHEDLQADMQLDVLCAEGSLFQYRRGDITCIVNAKECNRSVEGQVNEVLFQQGNVSVKDGMITCDGPSFICYK